MTARLLPWAIALLVSVILAVLLIPAQFLSLDFLVEAIENHAWSRYDEELLYILAGTLVLAAVGGLAGGLILDLTAGRAGLHSVLRFLTSAVSLGGLSPVQPLLAATIGTVLFWHLDWLEPTLWVSRVVLSVLFGIPLAAELALRYSDSPADGWLTWLRSAGGAWQEQAPALAGRLIWVALGGSLFVLIMSLRMFNDSTQNQVERPQTPAELLPVFVLFVVTAFLLWFAGGLIRSAGNDVPSEPDSADPEQCGVTQPRRPWLVWGLVAVVLLWPVVMTWIAGDPRPLSLPAEQPPESPMLPWTTEWGTNRQGQDLHAILSYAWRNSVEAGVIAAALSATAGVLWRFGSRYLSNRARNVTEMSLLRVPPILFFLVAMGLIVAFWQQAMGYQTVGIAVALVLLPQSLRLMRIDCGKMPTTIACQILLGTLLALGWSNGGLQFLGLMSPVEPTFTSVMNEMTSREGGENQWLLHRSLAMILVVVATNLLALGALVWSYNLPREFTRLRG